MTPEERAVLMRAAEGGYFEAEIDALLYSVTGDQTQIGEPEKVAIRALVRRALDLVPNALPAPAFAAVLVICIPAWTKISNWISYYEDVAEMLAESQRTGENKPGRSGAQSL
jgi:hypothetical protein